MLKAAVASQQLQRKSAPEINYVEEEEEDDDKENRELNKNDMFNDLSHAVKSMKRTEFQPPLAISDASTKQETKTALTEAETPTADHLIFGDDEENDGLSDCDLWSDGSSLDWPSSSDLSSAYDSEDELYGYRGRKKSGRKSNAELNKFDLRADISKLASFQNLPFRKKYLDSGLYSADKEIVLETPLETDIYSGLTERASRRRAVSSLSVTNGGSKKTSSPPLPLPIHFGEWLIGQETDFMLPYEVVYQHEHKLFEVDREPPPYKKIQKNIFVERKRRFEPAPVCHCEPEDGCGVDCINRCTFYECDVKTCLCGAKCTNQRLQAKEDVPNIKVFTSGDKRGFGLRTLVEVKRNQLVIEYKGEVISQELCIKRMENDYAHARCFYFLDYDNGEVLDGTVKGNEARFVNHSCEPNCHIEKWHVAGEVRVGLFASRDIRAGEELTYDYNFHHYGQQKQICLCGSRNCRGYMGKSTEYRDDVTAPVPNPSKKKLPTLKDKRKNLEIKSFARHRLFYRETRLLLLRNIFSLAKQIESSRPGSRYSYSPFTQNKRLKRDRQTLKQIIDRLRA